MFKDLRNKLVMEHLKFDNSISIEEKGKMLGMVISEEEMSFRKLSDATGIPLATLHGYINRRDVYRKKEVLIGARNNVLKEICTTNAKLRTTLELLRTIKEEVTDKIGTNYLREINQEVKRLLK